MIFILSKEENQQKWKDIIENQVSSGLTQKVWCQENDVSIHNLRYWRRRLQETPLDSSKIEFVSVSAKSLRNGSLCNGKESLTIKVGSASIEVDKNIDFELLNHLIMN